MPELSASLAESVSESLADLDALTDGPLADLAQRLALLDGMSAAIREAADTIRADIAVRMESDRQTIAGVGELRRTPTRATWSSPESKDRLRSDLIGTVSREVSLNKINGERDPLASNAAQLAADLLLDLLSWSGVKAGAKRIGIDPADYRGDVTGYRVSLAAGTEEP